MSHREDSAMQFDQSPRPHPFPDQVPTQTQLEELSSRDDPVLAFGEPADRRRRSLPG
jgi:hypothetical protein